MKQHHLTRTIEDMAGTVGENTAILSLLNGLTSEEIIGKRFGTEQMLYSFCVETDATREGDSVSFTKIGTIVFGERVNEGRSERVEARRKTEIESFAGTVAELGRRYAVPTPVNETLLKMVRTLEGTY